MSNTQSVSVALKRAKGVMLAGVGHPTRVNALIGISHPSDQQEELAKIEAIKAMKQGPDVVTDLSIVRELPDRPLWQRIADETPFTAATVPVYQVRSREGRLDARELLDLATEQMEYGVGLLTIHPTPTRELIKLSHRRLVPCTSRGGWLVIRDVLASSQTCQNVYLDIMDELVRAARRTGAVLSLGTAFRPANIFDTLDDVHTREIALQTELAHRIQKAGVGVVVEGPGHCRPSDIHRVAQLLRQACVPVMTLGPLPLDSAIGMDHIAAGIGATLLGLAGCAHILSTVTREEHTGSVPSLQSTVEAISSARIAAKIIDLQHLADDRREYEVASSRAKARSCIAGQTLPACSRCAEDCPLADYGYDSNA